jgi:hypothetical protein
VFDHDKNQQKFNLVQDGDANTKACWPIRGRVNNTTAARASPPLTRNISPKTRRKIAKFFF